MDSEVLTLKIQQNIRVISHFISHEKKYVNIHINSSKNKDYPRMIFILFSLSRAHKSGFLSKNDSLLLVSLFWDIYKEAKVSIGVDLFRYVDIYGMRFLNNLNEDYKDLIESFKQGNYSNLFTYPVLTYLYVSAYKECSELRKKFPYSESLFHESMNVFDFILFSNLKEKYKPFHFAELSAWGLEQKYKFIKYAYSFIENNFKINYPSLDSGSSGVAKCMEDFSRRGEMLLFSQCEKFIESRKLSRFGEYVNPSQESISNFLYTEAADSQYVCLDTNAHMLNAYLNLYERKN